MGVSQGTIVSVALKINGIIKCLPVYLRGSLYFDDSCICFRLKGLIAIERQIQLYLNSIQKWADKNRLQINYCWH